MDYNITNIYQQNISPLDRAQSTLLENFVEGNHKPNKGKHPNTVLTQTDITGTCSKSGDKCICAPTSKPTPTTSPRCATILVPTNCPTVKPTTPPTPPLPPSPPPPPTPPPPDCTKNVKYYKHTASITDYINKGNNAFKYDGGTKNDWISYLASLEN